MSHPMMYTQATADTVGTRVSRLDDSDFLNLIASWLGMAGTSGPEVAMDSLARLWRSVGIPGSGACGLLRDIHKTSLARDARDLSDADALSNILMAWKQVT